MKLINLNLLMTLFSKKIEATLVTLLIIFSVLTVQAQFFDQFNPKVTITLQHPPNLGLKVSKIAFGPATGTCSDQIIDAIQSDFVKHNIEVIDRANLTSVLAEHQLTLSGYVDQTSAAAMGKILGPSALIFVKVQVCDVKIDRLIGKKNVQYSNNTTGQIPNYLTRTRANLRGSIQAVDLTTGRIFGSQPLESSREQTNENTSGYPEAPSEFDVQNLTFKDVVLEVHRMFLPWSEPVTLYYYDNKEHGLKSAYEAMKSGNLILAYDLSKKNLEESKSDTHIKDRVLSHAYYNMGMSYMLNEEYDKAVESFQNAAKLHPGDIVSTAINDCNKAKALQISRQQVDQKASFDADKIKDDESKAAKKEQANTLTNTDVIKLVKMKLSNTIIIQKIKNSKCNFDTSADALVELTKAGVNDEIVVAMMNK